MKAFELIQILCRGFVEIEHCGTCEFGSSDLSELVCHFGHGIDWQGHFKKGKYFYCWQPSDEDPAFDDWTLKGDFIVASEGYYCLYFVED